MKRQEIKFALIGRGTKSDDFCTDGGGVEGRDRRR